MKSTGEVLRFGDFALDPANRVLRSGEVTIDLGGRYFDALLLLTRESGNLITKERLLGEVWHGVPVTDEALTQCIRTLRRTLGDTAAAPRFIETVPKHRYRFVAKVDIEGDRQPVQRDPHIDLSLGARGVSRWLVLTGSGGLGGAAAGALIGLIYGLILADGSRVSGAGLSLVAAIACCGALAGLFSALAIAAGIATAERFPELGIVRLILGGAGGGLIAGEALNMVGRDAISLVFGRRVADLPGGLEGAALGAVVATALWWAARSEAARARVWAGAALPGGLAGFALPLLGGTLFAGSLAAVSAAVPNSPFGLPLPWSSAGVWAMAIGGALEGALFCTGVAAGLMRVVGPSIILPEGT